MNILLVLEPVIYRADPDALVAHFPWAEAFRRIAESIGGRFGVVANRETCETWTQQAPPGLEAELFPLDAFAILADFADKIAYSQALYLPTPPPSTLLDQLCIIRERFRPDVVLTTAQNAYVVAAFAGTAMLHVEQPPLPRMGHPFRTGFDPCGHQVGAFTELHRDAILKRELPAHVADGASELLARVEASRRTLHPQGERACEALAELGKTRKIALLATQPVDAVTFEGAYRSIEMHDLLYDWARRLPPGWIGVPTYHAGQRLSEELETALARSCDRIRLLPRDLSCGLSEALVTQADGLVTISSTSAMAALLFRKQVAVVGRSPLSGWGVDRPELIDQAPRLQQAEAVRCLAVLTHRFSVLHSTIMADPARMKPHLQHAHDGTAADWYLDLADWSLPAAESLFNDAAPAQAAPLFAMPARDGPVLELAEIRSQWQDTIVQRDSLIAQVTEISHDRERIDGERADAVNRLAALSDELHVAIHDRDRHVQQAQAAVLRADILDGEHAKAVADRTRADADRAGAISQAEVLAGQLADAVAGRDRVDAQMTRISLQAESLADQLARAVAGRDRIDALHGEAIVQRDILAQELANAVADRDRIDALHGVAIVQRDILAQELDRAVADRDRIDNLYDQAGIQIGVLTDELARAVADRDRLDLALAEATRDRDVLAAELDVAIADREKQQEKSSRLQLEIDTLAARLHGLEEERDALLSRFKSVGDFWAATGSRRLAARLLGYADLAAGQVPGTGLPDASGARPGDVL